MACASPDLATSGVRLRRVSTLAVLVVVAAAACTSSREEGLPELPGAPVGSDVFVVGTVAPGDQSYVDQLTANFVAGGRLVARLDEDEARCVASRWVAIVDPAALAAGGISADMMVNLTLDRLRGLGTIDRRRATAMTESFAACDADHTAAFLDSLLLTSQITSEQRVCLATSLPPGLIAAVTVSALVDPQMDASLTTQYREALDRCPAS